jgi:murein DD-endopeptidase MepM/ murein hydrolase activator NlpD
MIAGTLELDFGRPVGRDIGITPKGGKFGAHRHYGGHKGVDFAAYLCSVKAIESGRVVCSTMRAGSKEKANYGNVIVIDHTPEAGPDQRHVYSLSAHLDSRAVYRNLEKKIEKGRTIGISGNSGTRQSYSGKPKADQKDYHLHFEIIDSPRKLVWNGSNFHSLSLREDPMSGYIGSILIIEYGWIDGQLCGAELPSRYDPFYRF